MDQPKECVELPVIVNVKSEVAAQVSEEGSAVEQSSNDVNNLLSATANQVTHISEVQSWGKSPIVKTEIYICSDSEESWGYCYEDYSTQNKTELIQNNHLPEVKNEFCSPDASQPEDSYNFENNFMLKNLLQNNINLNVDSTNQVSCTSQAANLREHESTKNDNNINNKTRSSVLDYVIYKTMSTASFTDNQSTNTCSLPCNQSVSPFGKLSDRDNDFMLARLLKTNVTKNVDRINKVSNVTYVTNNVNHEGRSSNINVDNMVPYSKIDNTNCQTLDSNKTLPSKYFSPKMIAKSTTRPSYPSNISRKSTGAELKCKICNIVINKTYTLTRHYKEHHGTNDNKVHCKHCDRYFDNYKSLVQHLYEINGSKKYSTVENNENNLHPKSDRTRKTNNFHKCVICTFNAIDVDELKMHTSSCHKQKLLNPIHAAFENKCLICNQPNIDYVTHNNHLKNDHPQLFFLDTSQPGNQNQPLSQTSNDILVSKVFFKCRICFVHFFSCTEAINHSNTCGTLSTWKCEKCNRVIQNKDRNKHNAQHVSHLKFSVYDAHKMLLNNVLCQCPNCMVHFEEKNIINHFNDCDGKNEGFCCVVCNLLLETDMKAHHEKMHEIFKLTLSDFIIVHYMTISEMQTNVSNSHEIKERITEKRNYMQSVETELEKNTKTETIKPKYKLFYCKVCKSYLEVTNAQIDVHKESKCQQSLSKLCHACGLNIAQTDFNSHSSLHDENKILSLVEFEFLTLQDELEINPPVPDYFPCFKCGVRFYSKTILTYNRHTCHQFKYNRCEICKYEFDEIAYTSHLPFHEHFLVNWPRLLSNCNVDNLTNLYLCKACDIIVDSYDGAIEHSQNHFTSDFEVPTNVCHTCKFKFEHLSFNRHVKLHDQIGNITKESLNIFKFTYTTLGTKDWFKMFNGAPYTNILSNSIYSTNNNEVKMHLTQNGPIELTMYKCGICFCYVEVNSVVYHAKDIANCDQLSDKHMCEKCGIYFYSSFTHDQHLRIHDIPNIEKHNYRIITFYKHINANTVKMKKGDEFREMENHEKPISISPNTLNRSSKIAQGIQKKGKKIIVHYFKCNECKICLRRETSAENHVCAATNNYKVCRKCKIKFTKASYFKHLMLHEKIGVKLHSKFTSFDPMEDNSDIEISEISDPKNDVVNDLEFNKTPSLTGIESVHHDSIGNVKTLKIFHYFKCNKCLVCFKSIKNVKTHSCLIPKHKTKCQICHELFSNSCYLRHIMLHKKYLDESLHFQVTQFDPSKSNEQNQMYGIKSKNNHAYTINNKLSKTSEKKENTRYIEPRKKYKTARLASKYINSDSNQHMTGNMKRKSIIYFKCNNCEVCFRNEESARNHTCFPQNLIKKCGRCHIKLPRALFSRHMGLHNYGYKLDPKVTLVNPKSINNEIQRHENEGINNSTEEGKITVFKCCDCQVLFPSEKTVNEHFEGYCPYEGSECSICGHKFHPSIILSHIFIKHTDSGYKESHDLKIVMIDKKSITKKKSIHKFYKCKECEVCYFNLSKIKIHISVLKHKPTKFKFCEECNLKFACRSLQEHMDFHEKLGMNTKDFDITVVDDSIITKSDMFLEPSTSLTPETKNSGDNVHPLVNPLTTTLYKCKECPIHFRDLVSLTMHLQTPNDHLLKPYQCSKCDLILSKNAIKYHIDLHHDKMKLSNKDLYIKTPSIYMNPTISSSRCFYSAWNNSFNPIISTPTDF